MNPEQIILLQGKSISVRPVMYAELKQLVENSQLQPGRFYRIVDYVTTVSESEEVRSAGHPFDIIVQAADEKTFKEEAHAILHNGDEYFAGCKIQAWKLKYCFANDATRFAWASEDGKGVIYHMEDEWGNKVPFDFKNIQFKRYKITGAKEDKTLPEGLADRYLGIKNKNTIYTIDEEDFVWTYVFCWIADDAEIGEGEQYPTVDVSVAQGVYPNDEGGFTYVYNNVIKECRLDEERTIEEEGEERTIFIYGERQRLNNTVMISAYSDDSGLFYGYYENVIGYGCYDNTIGNSFGGNTIGNSFGGNTIGNNVHHNTIGNYFNNNTIGNGLQWCTIGNNVYDNTIGNNVHHNTIGNDFNYNTIGNGLQWCTIGNDVHHNTIGNDVYHNTIGNNVYDNTIGNNFWGNTIGNNVHHNTIGNNVRYITVFEAVRNVEITGGSDGNTYVQNAQILNGTNGNGLSEKLQIEFEEDKSATQIAGLNSSGQLKIWYPADAI